MLDCTDLVSSQVLVVIVTKPTRIKSYFTFENKLWIKGQEKIILLLVKNGLSAQSTITWTQCQRSRCLNVSISQYPYSQSLHRHGARTQSLITCGGSGGHDVHGIDFQTSTIHFWRSLIGFKGTTRQTKVLGVSLSTYPIAIDLAMQIHKQTSTLQSNFFQILKVKKTVLTCSVFIRDLERMFGAKNRLKTSRHFPFKLIFTYISINVYIQYPLK